LDLARDVSSRFTFDSAGSGNAIWSPDGSQIIYANGGGQSADLFRKPSNGASKEEVIFHSDSIKAPLDWSSDGRWLLYTERSKDTGLDLYALPDTSGLAGGERKPIPYLVTPFNEQQAKFSPDGKWVAYSSNESGTLEVYVRPFPASSGGKWLVSNGGGNEVRWRPDGKELFYIAPSGALMAAPVNATGSALEVATPKALFRTEILGGLGGGATNSWRYAVSKDGQRFLINSTMEQSVSAPITIVTNWTAELKK
jgi:Tol biopolymer transport system component